MLVLRELTDVALACNKPTSDSGIRLWIRLWIAFIQSAFNVASKTFFQPTTGGFGPRVDHCNGVGGSEKAVRVNTL